MKRVAYFCLRKPARFELSNDPSMSSDCGILCSNSDCSLSGYSPGSTTVIVPSYNPHAASGTICVFRPTAASHEHELPNITSPEFCYIVLTAPCTLCAKKNHTIDVSEQLVGWQQPTGDWPASAPAGADNLICCEYSFLLPNPKFWKIHVLETGPLYNIWWYDTHSFACECKHTVTCECMDKHVYTRLHTNNLQSLCRTKHGMCIRAEPHMNLNRSLQT